MTRLRIIIGLVWAMTVSSSAVWGQPVPGSDKARRYQYFFLEGIKQQEKGNYSAAFDLLRHARDIKPDAAEVHFQLAGYYADLKQDTMVARCFEKAAALAPGNSTYQERIGQYLISQRQYEKAIDSYEQFYATHRDRSDVLMLLLRLYGTQNNYPKMIEMLDKIETQEGSSEQITLSKMQVYEQIGDKQKVFRELKTLVQKHPNDLNYRVMLGNWLLQNDKAEAALKEYKTVLKEDPDNEMAQMSMLDYYREKDMNGKADQLLLQLLRSKRTGEETKLTLMRQVIMENRGDDGDSAKVLSCFDEVLALPQQNADLTMLKAAYLSLLGRPVDEVNAVYLKALEIEPDNASARFQLIQSTWELQDYDRVIELCRPAQQYNPEEMAFYYFQGMAFLQKEDKDEALETFRKGVSQINSSDNVNIVSDFYAIMGDILHEKGLVKEAYEAYDSCLHWKPDNMGCLNNYAYFLSEEGRDLSRAELMSYKTIKAEPDNSTYLDTYAWILFRQGRYEESKIYIDQAIRNDSTLSSVVVEHAGDIHAMTGDLDGALAFWQQALDEGGGSALLQEKIRQRRYIDDKKEGSTE